MSTIPVLANADARRLFLDRHGLGQSPKGSGKDSDLLEVFQQLGFVQLDSINTVERAHHMILHARRQAYRPKNLDRLLVADRTLFEHWTHDASIIPAEFFPYWKMRFERNGKVLFQRWKKDRRDGFETRLEPVLDQIRQSGPVCSADVGDGEKRGSGGWWDWHPSKTALEFLWHTGQISVARRVSFRKFYDLTERVLASQHRADTPTAQETINWACGAALDRLGFATPGEIAAFWAMVKPAEAKTWCENALQNHEIIEVDIACVDGTLRRSYARADVIQSAVDAPSPPRHVRILSPFDPALRDRQRAERLFGFDYRIEVFVPAAKRKYGYYVFPVLEGDRLIGRIDMKCHRKTDTLNVTAFWPENRVSLGKGRVARLQTAIDRTRRFAGVTNIEFKPDWLRI